MSKKQLDVLIGAKPIAAIVFGDEREWRRVLTLKSELGLFRLRGQICGRVTTITERITAKETPGKAEIAAAAAADAATPAACPSCVDVTKTRVA